QKWISRLARGGETKRMSTTPESSEKQQPDGIAMPQPAAAPMILAMGIAFMAAGIVFGIAMSLVGLAIFIAGLGAWISHLLPGRGHVHEERAERRPETITATPNAVEQMRAGAPGYRMRLPLEVRPTSAGIKGGMVGGLVMPLPALVWGVL